jgi:hypothetical protein
MVWLSLGLSVGLALGLSLSLIATAPTSSELVEQWVPGIEAAKRFGSAGEIRQQLQTGKLIARGQVRGFVENEPVVIRSAQWQYLTFGNDELSVAFPHDPNLATYVGLEIGKAKGR